MSGQAVGILWGRQLPVKDGLIVNWIMGRWIGKEYERYNENKIFVPRITVNRLEPKKKENTKHSKQCLS